MRLPEAQRICGLRYTPRTGGDAGVRSGWLSRYEVYVSDDGQDWGQAVAVGTLQATEQPQTITFDARGRYVKLVGLSAVSGRLNMSAAELALWAGPVVQDPQPTVSPSVSPSAGPGGVPEGTKPAYVSAVESAGTGSVLVGDWDGDGDLNWAVRVGSRVVFYVDNVVDAPVYAVVSLGRASDEVLVGDWDGDGADTLALRRGATVLLQRRLGSAATERAKVEGLTASSVVRVLRRTPPGRDEVVVAG